MSAEDDLSSIMNRLEARLDAMEKGELPPQLREHMKGEKKESKDSEEESKDEKKEDDEMKEEKMYAKGDEYSDVITAEYLSWMEDTLKSAGVDTDNARAHFDQMAKAQLGGFDNPDAVDGAEYFGGQVRGRGQDRGSPSTGAISALTASGGKQPAGAMGPAELSKASYVTSASEADIEAAYEVYKAAALEQAFRGDLESKFASRFATEMEVAKAEVERNQFDARAPIAEVLKSIESLSERIDNLGSGVAVGTPIAKSASTVELPSTGDLGSMSWDEVHNLAGRALRGE